MTKYRLELYKTTEDEISKENAKVLEVEDTFIAAKQYANSLIVKEGYSVCRLYDCKNNHLVALFQENPGGTKATFYIMMQREPSSTTISELCQRLTELMNMSYIRIWSDGGKIVIGNSRSGIKVLELPNQLQDIIVDLVDEVLSYFTKPVFAINIYNLENCSLYYSSSFEEKGSLEVTYGGAL